DAVAIDPGDVEQVVDQTRLELDVPFDGRAELSGLLWQPLPRSQTARGKECRRQRRTQLVADGREKPVSRRAGCLRDLRSAFRLRFASFRDKPRFIERQQLGLIDDDGRKGLPL